MFVGGGVQDHFDGMIGHDRPCGARISDRAQDRADFGAAKVVAAAQFAVNVVKGDFADLEQHDLARAIGQKLAAEFRPDGATCPGHQNDAVGIGGDPVGQRFFHRFATQKLAGGDGGKVVNQRLCPDELRERRQGQHIKAKGLQAPGDLGLFRGRGGGHGQKNAVNFAVLHDGFNPVGRQDAQTGHRHGLQGDVVIKEGDDDNAVMRFQGGGQLDAGGARAIDQHAPAALAPAQNPEVKVEHGKAQADRGEKEDQAKQADPDHGKVEVQFAAGGEQDDGQQGGKEPCPQDFEGFVGLELDIRDAKTGGNDGSGNRKHHEQGPKQGHLSDGKERGIDQRSGHDQGERGKKHVDQQEDDAFVDAVQAIHQSEQVGTNRGHCLPIILKNSPAAIIVRNRALEENIQEAMLATSDFSRVNRAEQAAGRKPMAY